MDITRAARREYTYVSTIARTLWLMRGIAPDSARTFADIVEDIARDKPGNIAILFQDRTLTYCDLDRGANRFARWALGAGIRRGDMVAILMENRPEYLMAWLGLLKVGAAAALINTHLSGAQLAHSIGLAGARHAIIGAELAASWAEAATLIDAPPTPWIFAGGEMDATGGEDLDAALAGVSDTAIDREVRRGLIGKDRAFYIYTSGTTGMPKAANFTHMRMLYMMYGFVGALNATEKDRIYDVLPLYHSAGGICAVGIAFLTGGSIVIRKKFSAAEFWDDCHRYKPTFFQYIGELCRYLMNAPSGPHERDHGIRAITGNGLRPEIWRQFQDRFNIPRVVEFYGATEGNVAMLNYDGTVGSVGRIPSYARGFFPTRVLRFDVENEMPVRGPDGLCIECVPDEVGEVVGRIEQARGKTYDGYSDAGASRRKVLTDVFAPGDAWFRTGDLMRRDAHGYFYFVDRIGDTFRWKGENVSTGEVTEVLGRVPGILEANVYGVTVPGMEGRAGMAALVTDSQFNLDVLAGTLQRSLPGYARPVFLRLRPQLEVTGTFKLRKVELVAEGFNPAATSDPLYWFDAGRGAYELLDAPSYAAILEGGRKL